MNTNTTPIIIIPQKRGIIVFPAVQNANGIVAPSSKQGTVYVEGEEELLKGDFSKHLEGSSPWLADAPQQPRQSAGQEILAKALVARAEALDEKNAEITKDLAATVPV